MDSELNFRDLVEQLPLVVYIDAANAESSNIYISPQATTLLGYTPEEWASDPHLFSLTLHADDRERVLEEHRHTHTSGEPLVTEYRMLARDGREVWVHDEATVVCGEDGEALYLRGYLLDVTDRKERERVGWASEARMRAMLDAALDSVVMIDHHGSILEFNPAAERMFGHRRDEVIGANLAGLLVPVRLREAHASGLARYVAGGESRVLGERLEMPALRADGSEFAIELTIARVGLPGDPVFTAYMRDISEKASREAELLRSAAIVDSSFDAIIGRSPNGVVTSWNAAAERIFGYSGDEMIGQSIALLELPERAGDLARVNEQLQGPGRVDTFEAVRIRKDGARIDVETTVSPIFDRSGGLVAVSAIARDISGRRRAEELEESLRQAQKMEAVGQLAGGVAHDFNNILTAISGYTEFALRNLEKPNPDIELLREEIAGIRQAGERAAELTRQLLAYSRRQVMHRRVIDLNDVVKRSVKMLRRLIGENIAVELVVDADIPTLEADAAQLEQVILNLALNARDAMPNGGTLTIRTTHRSLVGAEAARCGLPDGDYLLLSVQDTGVGVADNVRDQVFEPFFTTKPLGEGTGLGLATAYGIVRQSGGTISLESERGVGSTFHVYLPATGGTATAAEVAALHANEGTERILLVEDEEILRDIIPEMLRAKGYEVVVQPDATAALAWSQNNKPDLVITDVLMPQLSGADLVERIRHRYPSLGALFISGYASSIIDEASLNSTTRFLPKPFTSDDIASAAREIIDTTCPTEHSAVA